MTRRHDDTDQDLMQVSYTTLNISTGVDGTRRGEGRVEGGYHCMQVRPVTITPNRPTSEMEGHGVAHKPNFLF